MTNERRILSISQQNVVDEYVNAHGLDASQISFEGNETTPIFDYEAVNALSLKLTDIQKIECEIAERDIEAGIITAHCTVTLPDGRSRSSEDSAQVGEAFGSNRTIDTIRLAENVAQARAVRRGIRSVGINLHRAHEQWKANGNQVVNAHTSHDPRKPDYDEIHAIAANVNHIVGKDKTVYQKFIAEQFNGRTSAKDLDNDELQRLKVTYRALARLQQPTAQAA